MFSSPKLIEDLQEELICSICRKYFTDPISIECGHSFCCCCLLCSWQEASTPLSCPECKSVFQLKDFQTNVHLGELAAIAKEMRPYCLQYPEGHGKCKVHQKEQNLFCEDDQSPICVSCSQSQEHEAHKLYSIEEAAENFRKKFQETMVHLWRKTENVAKQIAMEKIKFAYIQEEIEIQRRAIVSEFQKMQRFLTEEGEKYLSLLEIRGRANLDRLQKRRSELSHQNQEIMKNITELEEERKKPDMDLLQNMKEVLTRSESVLKKEIKVLPLNMMVCSIPGIMERIFCFKVDITLDCHTAEPGLIISEDLKTVRYGGFPAELPNNTGRFVGFAQVLATQSFISTRCYWEVEVPNNTAWCVGICKNSKDSEDYFMLMTVERFRRYFVFAMARHNLYSQVHKKFCLLTVSNLKVGIFLDYERGEISFYHVKNRYLIYTFPTTSFSGLLTPFFCLSKRVLVNDCSLMICVPN
ncbi:probable E3 ubiquitin-protein ligase TRIML1 [Notamacropus eugenii]|uniref:probable E3 ubiquitin-protein ligase TRIML1 n=1 Tax=Notamacropus eugenii TaxID=9315 RepID=UPI003B6820B8